MGSTFQDLQAPCERCDTYTLPVEVTKVLTPQDVDNMNHSENVTSVESVTTCEGALSPERNGVTQDGLVQKYSSPAREDVQPVDYTLPLGGSTSIQTITDESNTLSSTQRPAHHTTTVSNNPDLPSYNTAISFSLNSNVTHADITIGVPDSSNSGHNNSLESFISHDNHYDTLARNTSFKCITLDIQLQSEMAKIRHITCDNPLQSLPSSVTLSLPPEVTLSDARSKDAKVPLENLTSLAKFYLNEDDVESSPTHAACYIPPTSGESHILDAVQAPGNLETKAAMTEKAHDTMTDKVTQCLPTEVIFHEYQAVQETQSPTETNVYSIINKTIETGQRYRTEEFPSTLSAEASNSEHPQWKETKISTAETHMSAYIEMPLKIEELLGEYWNENTAPRLLDEATNVRHCSTTEIYKDVKFELEIPAVVIEHSQPNGNNEEQRSSSNKTRLGLATKAETMKDISMNNQLPNEGTREVLSETTNRNREPSTDDGMISDGTSRSQTLDGISRSTQDKANTMQHDSAATEKALVAMKRLEKLIQTDKFQEFAGSENHLDTATSTSNYSKSQRQHFGSVGLGGTGSNPHRLLGNAEKTHSVFHKSTEHHMGKGSLPQGKKIPAIKRLDMLIYD